MGGFFIERITHIGCILVKTEPQMQKVLVLFAHPMLEKSRMQSLMLDAITDLKKVYVHDLYEAYPDFDIDIEYEKELLLSHDVIVFQHPFYWYSAPPIIKQWMDLVLEHGWAYGKKGNKLSGKIIFNAISTGGPQQAYEEGGFNRFTINQFLAPFNQTAVLCKMKYFPPFVIHSIHKSTEEERIKAAETYKRLLISITQNEIDIDSLKESSYLNDYIPGNP